MEPNLSHSSSDALRIWAISTRLGLDFKVQRLCKVQALRLSFVQFQHVMSQNYSVLDLELVQEKYESFVGGFNPLKSIIYMYLKPPTSYT